MRWVSFLFLFVVLTACSPAAPDASPAQPAEAGAVKDWQAVVGKQLAQKQYAFTLIASGNGETVTMMGKQSGQDWSMRNDVRQIRVDKIGNHIYLTRSGTKETASPRQLGLMSPRDHLLWMQQVNGQVERVGTVVWQGLRVIVLQKDLDGRQVGQALDKWMGTPPKGLADIVTHQFNVRYRLWYVPNTRTLVHMVAEIRSAGQLRQTIQYMFRPTG